MAQAGDRNLVEYRLYSEYGETLTEFLQDRPATQAARLIATRFGLVVSLTTIYAWRKSCKVTGRKVAR